jgi:hypothetical protein
MGMLLAHALDSIRGGVGAGSESGTPSKFKVKCQLILTALENARELLTEIVHVVAQLHDGDDSLNLVMHLIPTEFLKPLMMVFQEVGIRILFTQFPSRVAVNCNKVPPIMLLAIYGKTEPFVAEGRRSLKCGMGLSPRRGRSSERDCARMDAIGLSPRPKRAAVGRASQSINRPAGRAGRQSTTGTCRRSGPTRPVTRK